MAIDINDSSTTLCIDTGNPYGVIVDGPLLSRLGLDPLGETVGVGSLGGGSHVLAAARAETIRVEDLELRDHTVWYSRESLRSSWGSETEGLLGNDVLKNFVVYLDLATHRVCLAARE